MNILKITLLIFLFTFSYEGVCQDKIEKLKGHPFDFKYQNRLYKNFQLGGILITNKNAYKEYKRFKKTKQISKILGRTSIVMIFATMVEGARQRELIYYNPDKRNYNFFETYFITGVTSLTFGVLLKLTSIGKKHEAIKIFNTEAESPPKIGKAPVNINLGFTTAGLGIRFSF